LYRRHINRQRRRCIDVVVAVISTVNADIVINVVGAKQLQSTPTWIHRCGQLLRPYVNQRVPMRTNTMQRTSTKIDAISFTPDTIPTLYEVTAQ
jgi:hypothetical protein